MLVVFSVRLFWNVASHVQIFKLFYRLEKLEELDVNTNNLEVYKRLHNGNLWYYIQTKIVQEIRKPP